MKLHDELPKSLTLQSRQSWPFKDMIIGQVLEIEKSESEIHKRARVAAHVHGKNHNQKFTTKTGSNGSLYIQRIK